MPAQRARLWGWGPLLGLKLVDLHWAVNKPVTETETNRTRTPSKHKSGPGPDLESTGLNGPTQEIEANDKEKCKQKGLFLVTIFFQQYLGRCD